MIQINKRSTLLPLILFLSLSSCYLPEIQYREYLRPVRALFKKERNYWTDRMELRGVSGTELVYYKNGRPALERFFNQAGLLKTVSYLGRNGEILRLDSLVYSDDELIAAYYFSEPGHYLQLRFLNYKRQGQLSQRSWFGSTGELLSREFFIFDRGGHRRMQLIFDENDSLLYSETYRQGTDKLDVQNTYSLNGNLASQIRYEPGKAPFKYNFLPSGLISKISRLQYDGIPMWSNDLFYNNQGVLERSNFSINGQLLFTYLGDLEFYRQSLRTWKHPYQPGNTNNIYRVSHRTPFIKDQIQNDAGTRYIEYRLPESGALFKRTTLADSNRPRTDTLYSNQSALLPAVAITYNDSDQVDQEISFDSEGNARWRHTWFRDEDQRVIREELFAYPDTFSAAVTRFYDAFSLPALSERFSSPDSFDGTWVFYHGGGINKSLFYNDRSELTESWLLRPAGDTIRHSTFQTLDYIRIESKLGRMDTLISQRRFTNDGMLNWELFFDGEGQLLKEVHRKKDGSIYRNVNYNPESMVIKSTTFAPVNIEDIQSGAKQHGDISSLVITRLNSRGEIVQIISKNSSGETAWEKRYAYRDGRLLKSAQLGADGKPVVISSYTHNEQGQILTETALDREGDLVHGLEYQYNEKHQMIWKKFSSAMTGSSSSNRYFYDETDQLQRTEIIEAQHFIEAVEYKYYPEFYLRIAAHYDPEGLIMRKEIENYFGKNVFKLSTKFKSE